MYGIWLVGLSNSQVLHLLIDQWSDKPGNIGTVQVTVYDHLPDIGIRWIVKCALPQLVQYVQNLTVNHELWMEINRTHGNSFTQ